MDQPSTRAATHDTGSHEEPRLLPEQPSYGKFGLCFQGMAGLFRTIALEDINIAALILMLRFSGIPLAF